MKKKIYLQPTVNVLSVAPATIMTGSKLDGVNSNADVNYGGADPGSGEIRVKEYGSYDGWEYNWSAEEEE